MWVHYEQQLKNSTEFLQKNNNQLLSLLKERYVEFAASISIVMYYYYSRVSIKIRHILLKLLK